MESILTYFIVPLVVTIIIEFLIYLAIIRKEPANLFIVCTLINAFTLPIGNIAQSFFGQQSILFIELGIAIVETFLIKALLDAGYAKATITSFVANLISFILSYILISFAFFG